MTRKEVRKVIIEGTLTRALGYWEIHGPKAVAFQGDPISIGKGDASYVLDSEYIAFEDHLVRITIEDV